MTYKGHISKGTIVLDEPTNLPEGAPVRIEVALLEDHENLQEVPTLAERLASVIGKAEGLPDDWAENHDAYLRKAYEE